MMGSKLAMTDEWKQDLNEVHKRIDDLGNKVNEGFLTLTTQVTRFATLIEERNKPSLIKQQLISSLIPILLAGLVGLLVFWLSHKSHS